MSDELVPYRPPAKTGIVETQKPAGTRCVTCPDCRQAFFIPLADFQQNGVPK